MFPLSFGLVQPYPLRLVSVRDFARATGHSVVK